MKIDKRTYPLFFFIILFTIASCKYNNVKNERYRLPIISRETTYSFDVPIRQGVVSGEAFVYLCENTGEVRSRNLSDGEDRILIDTLAAPTLLSADETGVCVYEAENETLLLFRPDGTESGSIPVGDLTGAGHPLTAMDSRGGIVVLTDGTSLWIVRKSDGKISVTKPTEEIGSICSLRILNDKEALIITEKDGGFVYRIDLKNGRGEKLSERTCVCLSGNGKTAYYSDGSGIYEVTRKEESFLGRLKGDGELLGFEVSENTILTIRENALILSPRPGSANTVTILYADDQTSLYASMSRATGITSSSLTLPAESYMDKLNTKLLAGDRDFDIAVVSGTVQEVRTVLRSLIQYHLYSDLGGNDLLRKHLEETYPGVLSLISAENGEVFMLPLRLYYEFDRFDLTAEEVGISRPNPAWTMKELWEVCASLEGTGRSVFQSKFPRRASINLLNLLYNTLDECVDFLDPDTLSSDTEAVILDFLCESELHIRSGTLFGEDPIFGMASTGDPFVYSTDVFGSVSGSSVFGVFPVSSEGRKSSLAVNMFLFVNPNTEKKDLTLELLSELTDETNRYNTEIFAAPLWPSLDRYYKGQLFISAMSSGSETFFAELEDFLPDYYINSRLEWADMPVRAIDAGLAFIEGSAGAEETARVLYNELVYSVRG